MILDIRDKFEADNLTISDVTLMCVEIKADTGKLPEEIIVTPEQYIRLDQIFFNVTTTDGSNFPQTFRGIKITVKRDENEQKN